MAQDKWMQKASEKMGKKGTKGSLHKALHVPEDKKIPTSKLNKASHSKNSKLRKKANFAKNARKSSKS
jgi:hypothetical protein